MAYTLLTSYFSESHAFHFWKLYFDSLEVLLHGQLNWIASEMLHRGSLSSDTYFVSSLCDSIVIKVLYSLWRMFCFLLMLYFCMCFWVLSKFGSLSGLRCSLNYPPLEAVKIVSLVLLSVWSFDNLWQIDMGIYFLLSEKKKRGFYLSELFCFFLSLFLFLWEHISLPSEK